MEPDQATIMENAKEAINNNNTLVKGELVQKYIYHYTIVRAWEIWRWKRDNMYVLSSNWCYIRLYIWELYWSKVASIWW